MEFICPIKINESQHNVPSYVYVTGAYPYYVPCGGQGGTTINMEEIVTQISNKEEN